MHRVFIKATLLGHRGVLSFDGTTKVVRAVGWVSEAKNRGQNTVFANIRNNCVMTLINFEVLSFASRLRKLKNSKTKQNKTKQKN